MLQHVTPVVSPQIQLPALMINQPRAPVGERCVADGPSGEMQEGVHGKSPEVLREVSDNTAGRLAVEASQWSGVRGSAGAHAAETDPTLTSHDPKS